MSFIFHRDMNMSFSKWLLVQLSLAIRLLIERHFFCFIMRPEARDKALGFVFSLIPTND